MSHCRKEIAVLQSENYSLERQLFSYQRSLAVAQARNQQPSDDTTLASAANGEYHDHRDYYARHESTDTEYAWTNMPDTDQNRKFYQFDFSLPSFLSLHSFVPIGPYNLLWINHVTIISSIMLGIIYLLDLLHKLLSPCVCFNWWLYVEI